MVGHPLAHRKLFTSPASGLQGVAPHTGKGVGIGDCDMPDQEIKVGDVVELKSGSSPMTVTQIDNGDDGTAHLALEKNNEISKDSFPVEALKIYVPRKRVAQSDRF